MENRILLFFTGCFTLLLSSCLGSGDDYEIDIAKNCQISSFSLSHDSIPELETTKFTIDQIGGRIFNADSLPYGTKVDKVIAKVSYISSISIGTVQVMQEAVGDTIYWNGNDSLDYSKPVIFLITAYDGETKKAYETKLNIHQVIPDSMVWTLENGNLPGTSVIERKVIAFAPENVEQYYMFTRNAEGNNLYTANPSDLSNWESKQLTGLPAAQVKWEFLNEYEGQLYVPASDQKLYRSSNGKAWEVVDNSPAVVSVLGVLKEEKTAKIPSALAIIASVDGLFHFASMNKEGVWTVGKTVPAQFPLSGSAVLSYNQMFRERLLLAGGKNAGGSILSDIWSTMDGLNWVSTNPLQGFGNREGASIAQYDSTFFLIGGFDKDGKALKDIYRSRDNGITWALSDTLVVMPQTYKARAYASMIVDNKTNFMYLFGGKDAKGKNDLEELWRGRINRLGFRK